MYRTQTEQQRLMAMMLAAALLEDLPVSRLDGMSNSSMTDGCSSCCPCPWRVLVNLSIPLVAIAATFFAFGSTMHDNLQKTITASC
jgi:hypothetical protein